MFLSQRVLFYVNLSPISLNFHYCTVAKIYLKIVSTIGVTVSAFLKIFFNISRYGTIRCGQSTNMYELFELTDWASQKRRYIDFYRWAENITSYPLAEDF